MLVQIIKVLLCLMLYSVFVSCDSCAKYQDIAVVDVENIYGGDDIDSVAMIVNGSIVACGDPRYVALVGSKTHSVKFPINAHIKLFVEDSLWKELYFEMFKNTIENADLLAWV